MNKIKAFTLIELLVVVAMIITLTGLSFAYINNLTGQKQLSKEAEKFIDVIDLARKKANLGDDRLCFGGTDNTSDGFVVEIISSNTYKLSPLCKVGATATETTYQTESNVSFLNTGIQIEFRPYRLLGAEENIILKETNINKCISIEVETSGTTELSSVACP